MSNEELELYNRWLSANLENTINVDKESAKISFAENFLYSPAYQHNSIVNGVLQPLVATRKETNKCSITVIPGNVVNIGDLIEVFGEHWICVEMYTDEFGMCYGELWMCNHIFTYQDFELNTINKYAIIDDGSYSNGKDNSIKVTDNKFICYVSMDRDSQSLYIDKRLGISIIHDKDGNEILEVGKIAWIDNKSHNFGGDSHLMVFGVVEDLYNPDNDNIDKMICDYIPEKTSSEDDIISLNKINSPTTGFSLSIIGNKTIRIGSSRAFKSEVLDADGSDVDVDVSDIDWYLGGDLNGITLSKNGDICRIAVVEDTDLVGSLIEIKCFSKSGKYKESKILVEVI